MLEVIRPPLSHDIPGHIATVKFSVTGKYRKPPCNGFTTNLEIQIAVFWAVCV
jgi:hypothetical protein